MKGGAHIMEGFKNFLAEQGVVGLAVGFILGGAVSDLVASIVENILNPLIGIALGDTNLDAMDLSLGGEAVLSYGAVLTVLINFIVIAAFVYWGVKKLGLDKLDKEKPEDA